MIKFLLTLILKISNWYAWNKFGFFMFFHFLDVSLDINTLQISNFQHTAQPSLYARYNWILLSWHFCVALRSFKILIIWVYIFLIFFFNWRILKFSGSIKNRFYVIIRLFHIMHYPCGRICFSFLRQTLFRKKKFLQHFIFWQLNLMINSCITQLEKNTMKDYCIINQALYIFYISRFYVF